MLFSTGGKPKAKPRRCGKCEGVGSVKKPFTLAPGVSSMRYVECNSCKGWGELYREKDRCKDCSGSGLTDETKILEAYIPKGSPDGFKVVLSGEADQEYGKETGSVIIEVQQQVHPVFQRRNNKDLYATIKISLTEAICGLSRVVLKHLDGRGVRINTPPGTVIRPNEIIKIPGEGMPIPRSDSCGDLYLNVDIQFPENGWCVEGSDLRKIREVLTVAPNSLADFSNISEAQTDDVEYKIIKKEQLPDYPEPTAAEQSQSSAKSDAGSSKPFAPTESCTTQ